MSVADLGQDVKLVDRTIRKYRVNHISISICPLTSDGITECGHDVVNLKEAEIDSDAALLAELQRVCAAKLKALKTVEDIADPRMFGSP